MSDAEGPYDPEQEGLGPDETKARDGNVHHLPGSNGSRTGSPIDDQSEEGDGQQVWEFEEPSRKVTWASLIPKGPPVKFHRAQKGKTLPATGAIPDPTEPVDTVCETVLEYVKISFVRDAEFTITETNVTFVYGVRGTWSAKSEAARAALGLPESVA